MLALRAVRPGRPGLGSERSAVTRAAIAAGLPPGLALDWCRAGRPDPSAWIEEKLDAILSEERHRSVA